MTQKVKEEESAYPKLATSGRVHEFWIDTEADPDAVGEWTLLGRALSPSPLATAAVSDRCGVFAASAD